MKSLWDDQEAAQYVGDLVQRVYTSRLLGREKSLILQGGGGTSVKIREKNVFGEEEDILYMNGIGRDLENIEADGFSPVRLKNLIRLAKLDSLSDTQLANEIQSNITNPSAPALPLEAILHAVLPHKYVDHTQADAVLAITNTPSGLERVREIYDDAVVIIPYARSGFPLAKLCAETFSSGAAENTIGIVLMQQGIVSFGETARISYERMIDLVTRAKQYLIDRGARPILMPTVAAPDKSMRHELAALRQAVSASAGFPVIMSMHADSQCLSFARRDDVSSISQQGPATPDHVVRTKRLPLLGRNVQEFRVAYEQYFAAHTPNAGQSLTLLDSAPRVILDPEFGMCTIGRTAKEAAIVNDIYRHTMEIILTATALEEYQALPAQDFFDVECAELEQAKLRQQDELPMFAGEIALVTGAASGIGKACVEAFLARGAAVVGLDINPRVTQTFDRGDFLGLCCDVTDEDAVYQALETAVKTFGGLDMLVLNAGIFPPGCRIDSLQSSQWRKVMRVNLDANLVLMREAYPLLKSAPRHGRVVIMSSRNVPAPGPGAVAYSASKAALTQLARVAALEWGKDGIRVNIVNPHAVFDTGIWTEEVLRARAEYYGLTVEQYKKKNVLRVEITSRDVGELVAEMCGPLFAKTTGAQVPIDGGSNRVI
jgi:rhamnose utilization protein RhaD (predicted bifunctional aldolase and dehydrogenase)/NAD(P)-dependent dehydrogenase (short-subunit alcohol dehydrogenase family)